MKLQPMSKHVLFVFGEDKLARDDQNVEARLSPEDKRIKERLVNLGCMVDAKNSVEADVSKWNEADISAVVIAPSAKAVELKNRFREVTVPVVVLAGALYEEMRMTGAVDFYQYGQKSGELKVKIVSPNHPLAAELRDSEVLCKGATIAVGVLGSGATRVAIVEDACKAVMFGYEEGTPMVGLNAPARRVGLFFDNDAIDEQSRYWKLFDAGVEWAVGQQSRHFVDVFRAEWSEIQTRRQHHYSDVPRADREGLLTSPPANLVGLSLSGGGIRAATFGLGLLQGLHEQGLLRVFDYISTVSGGGYLGGWWSAWLRRNPDEQRNGHDIFPPPERIMSASDVLYQGQTEKRGKGTRAVNEEVAEDLLSAGNDPIHHLRLFANYLTPRKGALSSDTWRAAAVISRDLVLTWVILLPLLIAAVLVGKIYFIIQPEAWDSNSSNAFFLFNQLAPTHVLLSRLLLIAWPLLGILALVGVMTCAWMLSGSSTAETRREWVAGKLGAMVVIILGVVLLLAVRGHFNRVAQSVTGGGVDVQAEWFVVWAIMAVLVFLYVFWPRTQYATVEDRAATTRWQREVRRNLIIRVHAMLLVLLLLTAVVLLLAGFGHEAVNYLFAPTAKGDSVIGSYVAKAGGWLAVIAALGGSIFTAIKTSPAGGSDPREASEPSLASRLIFKFTPPLIIVVLAVVASWVANILLSYANSIYSKFGGTVQLTTLESEQNLILFLSVTTCFGIVLSFYFALVEANWKYDWVNQAMLVLWGVLALFMLVTLAWVCWIVLPEKASESVASGLVDLRNAVSGLAYYFEEPVEFGWTGIRILLLVFYAGVAVLAFRLAADEKRRLRSILWPVAFVVASVASVEWALYGAQDFYGEMKRAPEILPWIKFFTIGGIAFGFIFALAETFTGRRDNKRALCLVAGVYVITMLLFILSLAADTTDIRFTHQQELKENRILDPVNITGDKLLAAMQQARLASDLQNTAATRQQNEQPATQTGDPADTANETDTAAQPTVETSAEANDAADDKPTAEQDDAPVETLNKNVASVAVPLAADFDGLLRQPVNHTVAQVLYLRTGALAAAIAGEPERGKVLNSYVAVTIGQFLLGLIGTLLTWVIAMGWMADPNALSMHTFYKSRLVRAYLGASNKHRSEQQKGITEAVEGDDVMLQDLQNTTRGAPYHLINTTLNLVGGRDLTTAQRSAATFVLSKRYCGSSRTGYRDTREYMGGQLTLGTAVAVSGAAASPNMGAKTQTASLAMLMTFLNVRLGHWSPTPNKMDWRASKARLWPFYVMREFLSQTNDLSTYCYLTDGGHFDNTGLYSLVERGCRFIIATDCGADPRPCFQDVGDAMRRCRIDFDTEFDIDISPFTGLKKGEPSKQHFLVGTVRYSIEHAKSLGWYKDRTELWDKAKQCLDDDKLCSPEEEQLRTGIIIIFKPTLTNRHETADVRQYGLENPVFPQQKTADQWYDEAQFESYRQLGQLCAELAFRDLDVVKNERKFAAGNRMAKFALEDVRKLFEQARDKYDPKCATPTGHNGHDERRSSVAELQKLL
ncbi:MAG TPA: patatin-like phospholipase family protein [Pyrinomonadaceae bacterium]|jgi:hypothetical protein